MSHHPFPLYVPMGGRTNGPDISTEQLVRISQMTVLIEMSDRLRGHVKRFNESNNARTRKKEIEQLVFWRGVHFPELGKVLHPNRIGLGYKNKTVIPQRFIVSDSDIVIERIKNSSQSEYEEVKRFPLNMITLDLKLEQDKEKLEHGREYELIINVFWRTGSEGDASFDSANL